MRFDEKIDFSRWAIVSYNDDSGLGRMATDMRKVLNLGHFFVLPSVKFTTKAIDGDQDHLVPIDASNSDLAKLMENVQGIIVLERLTHHLGLVNAAKERGIIVTCVPMWEHFAGWLSLQNQADFFLCPTGMTHRILRLFGFANSVQVPCPIDTDLFPKRKITGKAKRFIHNGGTTNQDDRKGTRDVISAFKKVPNPDIRLSVRLQKKTDLPELDPRIDVFFGNLEDPGELYADGDVAIQPSKLEGLGFTVFEAAISGLPVITTDYPPMNEFIQDRQLLCKVGWRFHKVRTTSGIHHSHLKKPKIDHLAKIIQWCSENDMQPFSERNSALRSGMFAPEQVRDDWRRALQACVDGRIVVARERRPLSPATPLFFFSSLFFRSVRAFFQWRKGCRGPRSRSQSAQQAEPGTP